MMFAKIYSRPTMCSDDGRALNLEWMVQTSPSRNAVFWSNALSFDTEKAAREYCEKKGAEVLSVRWT